MADHSPVRHQYWSEQVRTIGHSFIFISSRLSCSSSRQEHCEAGPSPASADVGSSECYAPQPIERNLLHAMLWRPFSSSVARLISPEGWGRLVASNFAS